MKNGFKIIGCFLIAMLLYGTNIYAQEADGSLGLSFEGDSAEFITYETGSAYEDMMPGEERVQQITLTNNDYRELKFYVRASYTEPLGEGKANEQIAYDIQFSNNGEAFYNGKIGGMTKANMNTLETNYLLKTLKRGESTKVDLTIKIDGDSMDNTYQGTQGNMNLIFSVEHDDETPMEKVTTIVQKIPVINKIPGINTGDTTATGILLGIFTACSAVILIWGLVKVRNRKERSR